MWGFKSLKGLPGVTFIQAVLYNSRTHNIVLKFTQKKNGNCTFPSVQNIASILAVKREQNFLHKN